MLSKISEMFKRQKLNGKIKCLKLISIYEICKNHI